MCLLTSSKDSDLLVKTEFVAEKRLVDSKAQSEASDPEE